jgi:prepilin-type N-terminal cleavage/methylation domain-containing protein
MIGAARIPKIPPTPFDKGGEVLTAFPPLKKGRKGGFAPGFTLVEVIVTIIAAGILGAMFINFMGTAMSGSTRSIEYVQGEAAAEATLERILADYVFETNRDPMNALVTLKSQADSPTLRYGSNVTMRYITYTITGNAATENILTSGTSNTLKVTVLAAGNDLTTLLTKSRVPGSPAVAF